jgi:hypothetical protein
MPLGPWKDFSGCLIAQRKKGYSDERAHKICGALEQKIGSQKEQSAAEPGMSFPPQQKQEEKPKPKEEESAQVTLSQSQAEVVLSALVNAKEAVGGQAPELSQQLDQAIAAFKEVANVSE